MTNYIFYGKLYSLHYIEYCIMEEEIREKLTDLDNRLSGLFELIEIDKKKESIKELENESTQEDFWKDAENAKKVLKALDEKRDIVSNYESINQQHHELKEIFELAVIENDEASIKEIYTEILSIEKKVKKVELINKFSSEDDNKNAILTIHPGAGGTESQDWASMLMRMYTRWMERKNYKFNIMDIQSGEEAGIKNVTIEVSGNYAFGQLKAEIGIHRLVRISPFDANSRRHTSFASVFVYPEIEDDINIEINPTDLKIDTYRASGAGGQHVNKTDSAVRITHIPSGIVVQCQNERSQFKNKANALKILKSRLYQLEKEKEASKKNEIEKSKKDIAWGSQIRSYVLHPYNMVKDHRTKIETGNVNAVLDGEIDNFIEGFLLSKN